MPYWQSLLLDKPTTPSDKIFCNHHHHNNNYNNNNNNYQVPWDLAETETFLDARAAPSHQAGDQAKARHLELLVKMEPEELTLEAVEMCLGVPTEAEQVAVVLEDSSAKGPEGLGIVEKAQQEEILALDHLEVEATLAWEAVFQVHPELWAEDVALMDYQACKVR